MSTNSETMSTKKQSLFVMQDGKNLMFTFILVSSLFLLWGFCNGMIDVMDKHFQEELHLTLSQSAWVQFAHYLGYFLMSLPAGWLATKLGYKGGIIAGLLMVAVGGLWFIPATHIAAFWAFLLGVCFIASGLTFLETIANPYTTVLGPPQYAATRINLAQSCNGIGWIFGPIAGGLFFYGKDASGASTGSQTLWIPYAGVAAVVLLLAVVFYFAKVPDIKTEDDYHLDDSEAVAENPSHVGREVDRGLVYFLLLLNAAVLTGICGMILWLILSLFSLGQSLVGIASAVPHPSGMPITAENSLLVTICAAGCLIFVVVAVALIPTARKISHHSIWSHPHFSAATLAQFFYVAAQAGIFSFLINYMTSEPPAIPAAWDTAATHSWFETGTDGVLRVNNQGASNLASLGFIFFLVGRFTGAGLLKKFSAHKILGLYGVLNVVACLLVFCKLGWLSVACVFLSYFFMSIMFPTIFALGIFGLGVRAKKASAFIVMAIMGGAILPKLMGAVADNYDMSRGFIVPLVCFAFVALYGFCWSKLSHADSLQGVSTSRGH
ncbi:MAG: MFS transporter [Planctomycetota bacterium]|nr:MFS transporter [Planctomycetota bacterium]